MTRLKLCVAPTLALPRKRGRGFCADPTLSLPHSRRREWELRARSSERFLLILFRLRGRARVGVRADEGTR